MKLLYSNLTNSIIIHNFKNNNLLFYIRTNSTHNVKKLNLYLYDLYKLYIYKFKHNNEYK